MRKIKVPESERVFREKTICNNDPHGRENGMNKIRIGEIEVEFGEGVAVTYEDGKLRIETREVNHYHHYYHITAPQTFEPTVISFGGFQKLGRRSIVRSSWAP